MQEATRKLVEEVEAACRQLGFEKLQSEAAELEQFMQAPDFWADNEQATEKSKRLARLKQRIEPWKQLRQQARDLKDLAVLKDDSLSSEIETQLADLRTRFEKLQTDLQLSGPYDDHSAILGIHAGTGGTDAQDWAEMLMRMYLRWAEKSGYKTQMLTESTGEEAGIKSATLKIEGGYAYGKLKGEHGVHRLVRLSPFNADNLRQTSFALVEVLPLIEQPEEVEIDEKDLKIDVFRAGGHGGQSVNTTDSAVRITHMPTGIVVTIQNERSQLQNKATALGVLRSRLAALAVEQHKDKVSELRGPNVQAEWGNQIRSYVLHPYTMVKDNRTKHETSDVQAVLDGELDGFIEAYLKTPSAS